MGIGNQIAVPMRLKKRCDLMKGQTCKPDMLTFLGSLEPQAMLHHGRSCSVSALKMPENA